MKPEKDRPALPWPLIIMFMVITPAIVIGGLIYSNGLKTRMVNNIKNELESVSELQVDQIIQWKSEKMADADVIGENLPIIRQIDRCLYGNPKAQDITSIRTWMGSIVRNMDYLNCSITNRNGNVKFAYPENDSLVGPNLKKNLPGIIREKKVVLSDLHQVAPGSIVHLDLIIPLMLRTEPDTLLTGLLILRVDPRKKLYPLISKWSSRTKTTETLLIRREGDSVLYLNDLKLSNYQALTLKLPVSNAKLIGSMAAKGQEGVVEGIDYRGEPVIAAIKKVPGFTWYMISKIDKSEINSRLSGEMFTIMLLVILLIVATGTITGWTIWHLRVKFYRDLYRTRTEKLLIESHFSNILKYANDIILLLNAEYKIVRANDKATEIYQYSPEDLSGMNITVLRVPGTDEEFKRNMANLESTGKAFYETTHRKKDGSVFPIEVSVHKFEVSGKTYYQAVSRDITERKMAAMQLERSNLMMRATIESTADGLLVVDNSGRILVYNQKFSEMWGIPKEMLDSKDDSVVLDFATRKVKNPTEFIDTIHDLYDSDSKSSFSTIEFLDDRVIERYSQPLRIDEKTLIRVWSFSDITEKINSNRQLLSAKERAEESDRLKTAFLHNISHEIRTPMNAIVGFSALLDDPDIDQATRKSFTSIITESTNQLLSLISDIVEISNIEAGQVKVNFSEVNINFLIRDLISQAKPGAMNKKLELKTDITMSDDLAVINTDKTKLYQIIGCFINNAIKFTESGSVIAGYRVVDHELDFYVRDTGIGIAAEMQDKIFDRFFQVEAGTSRLYSGAGLGLSISRSYAELLGCTILLESQPGKGSEFILRHPL